MRTAFKEWAIIIDALARGEQVFILRKGGIHEGRGGFHPEHQEFLLFPTLFHQQRDAVLESAQARFDQIAPSFPPPGTLRLEYWARLLEWHQLDTAGQLSGIRGLHIWKDEVLAERFEWGKEKMIFALVLRIFRLPQPVELPMLPEYGGCKSWVELAHSVSTTESSPVLTDAHFRARVGEFRKRIELA